MIPYNPRAPQEDEGSVRVQYRPLRPTAFVSKDTEPFVAYLSHYLRYFA
jgi:hypothetical protein